MRLLYCKQQLGTMSEKHSAMAYLISQYLYEMTSQGRVTEKWLTDSIIRWPIVLYMKFLFKKELASSA
jgi:hypothetical protein